MTELDAAAAAIRLATEVLDKDQELQALYTLQSEVDAPAPLPQEASALPRQPAKDILNEYLQERGRRNRRPILTTCTDCKGYGSDSFNHMCQTCDGGGSMVKPEVEGKMRGWAERLENALHNEFMEWWPTSEAARTRTPETSGTKWGENPRWPVTHWLNVEDFLMERYPDAATGSKYGGEYAQPLIDQQLKADKLGTPQPDAEWLEAHGYIGTGNVITQAFLNLHNRYNRRPWKSRDDKRRTYELLLRHIGPGARRYQKAGATELGKWYHVSPHKLPEGEILKPAGGASPWGEEWYAPGSGREGEQQYVWVGDGDWMQNYGFANQEQMPYVYEIEPSEKPRLYYPDRPSAGYVVPSARIVRMVDEYGDTEGSYDPGPQALAPPPETEEQMIERFVRDWYYDHADDAESPFTPEKDAEYRERYGYPPRQQQKTAQTLADAKDALFTAQRILAEAEDDAPSVQQLHRGVGFRKGDLPPELEQHLEAILDGGQPHPELAGKLLQHLDQYGEGVGQWWAFDPRDSDGFSRFVYPRHLDQYGDDALPEPQPGDYQIVMTGDWDGDYVDLNYINDPHYKKLDTGAPVSVRSIKVRRTPGPGGDYSYDPDLSNWAEVSTPGIPVYAHRLAMPAVDAYDNLYKRPGYEINPRPVVHRGPWYHGTDKDLPEGTILVPSPEKSYWRDFERDGRENRADWVWMDEDPEIAKKFSRGHVYEVEPLDEGPWEWNGGQYQPGGYASPRARIVRKVYVYDPYAEPRWHRLAMPQMYRGLGLRKNSLPPDLSERIESYLDGNPDDDLHYDLLNHLDREGEGLGTWWSRDRDVASEYVRNGFGPPDYEYEVILGADWDGQGGYSPLTNEDRDFEDDHVNAAIRRNHEMQVGDIRIRRRDGDWSTVPGSSGRWASHRTAMPAPAPKGLRFEHTKPVHPHADYLGRVEAYVDDHPVGHIEWLKEGNPLSLVTDRKPGEVSFVFVHPNYRRQSIATEMFDWAKKHVAPDLHHSERRTDLGEKWVDYEQGRELEKAAAAIRQAQQVLAATVNQDVVKRLDGEFKEWWKNTGYTWDFDERGDDEERGPIGNWPTIEEFLEERYPAAHRGMMMGQEMARPLLDGVGRHDEDQHPRNFNMLQITYGDNVVPYETGPEAVAQHGYDPREVAAAMLLLHNKSHPLRGYRAQEDQARLDEIARKRDEEFANADIDVLHDIVQKRHKQHQHYLNNAAEAIKEAQRVLAMPQIDAYDPGAEDTDDYLPPDQAKPRQGKWYHVSPTKLDVGSKLTPGGGETPWIGTGIQPERHNWVWMDDGDNIESWQYGMLASLVGKGEENPWVYVYEVQPDEGPYPWNGTGQHGHVAPSATVVSEVPTGKYNIISKAAKTQNRQLELPLDLQEAAAAIREAQKVLGMPTYYHHTRDPHFKIDLDRKPDNAVLDRELPHGGKGLWVSLDKDHWRNYHYKGRRPYVVELFSEEDLGDSPNELFVGGEQLKNLRVKSVEKKSQQHYDNKAAAIREAQQVLAAREDHGDKPTTINPEPRTEVRPSLSWETTEPPQDPLPLDISDTIDIPARTKRQRSVSLPVDRKPMVMWRGINLDLSHPGAQKIMRTLLGETLNEDTSEYLPGMPTDDDIVETWDNHDYTNRNLGQMILDHAATAYPDQGLGRHWTPYVHQAKEWAIDQNFQSHPLPVLFKSEWMGAGEDSRRRYTNGDWPDEGEVTMLHGSPQRITQVYVQHPQTGKWHPVLAEPQNREASHRTAHRTAMPAPPPEGLHFKYHHTNDSIPAGYSGVTQGGSHTFLAPAVAAYVGDKPVGYVEWWPTDRYPNASQHYRYMDKGKPGEVYYIYVRPEFRRHSIATEMFDWAKQNAEPDLHHSPKRSELGKQWIGYEEGRELEKAAAAIQMAQQVLAMPWRTEHPDYQPADVAKNYNPDISGAQGGGDSSNYLVGPKNNVWWHGSASGDIGGGNASFGLHVGDYQTAADNLASRVGKNPHHPEGRWTGATSLAEANPGKFDENGNQIPDSSGRYSFTHSDGTPMHGSLRPNVFPVKIVGPMGNTTDTAASDGQAHALMRRQHTRPPKTPKGYYYINAAEGIGVSPETGIVNAVSAALPSVSHVEKLDPDKYEHIAQEAHRNWRKNQDDPDRSSYDDSRLKGLSGMEQWEELQRQKKERENRVQEWRNRRRRMAQQVLAMPAVDAYDKEPFYFDSEEKENGERDYAPVDDPKLLFENATGKWYHASPQKLDVGTVLKPGGGPAPFDGFAPRLPGRKDWVWMDTDEGIQEWFYEMGRYLNRDSDKLVPVYLYEVQPDEGPYPWNGTGSQGHVSPAAKITAEIPIHYWTHGGVTPKILWPEDHEWHTSPEELAELDKIVPLGWESDDEE